MDFGVARKHISGNYTYNDGWIKISKTSDDENVANLQKKRKKKENNNRIYIRREQ